MYTWPGSQLCEVHVNTLRREKLQISSRSNLNGINSYCEFECRAHTGDWFSHAVTLATSIFCSKLFLLVSSCWSECGASLAGLRDPSALSSVRCFTAAAEWFVKWKQAKLQHLNRFATVTEVVLSLCLLSRARCKSWDRGTHRAACHLSPGGDGFVQQQAQTEAGPPQPGNGRAHVTPHTERRNPKTKCEHTHV